MEKAIKLLLDEASDNRALQEYYETAIKHTSEGHSTETFEVNAAKHKERASQYEKAADVLIKLKGE